MENDKLRWVSVDSEFDMQALISGIRSRQSMFKTARRLRYLKPDNVGGSSAEGCRLRILVEEVDLTIAGGPMLDMMLGGLA